MTTISEAVSEQTAKPVAIGLVMDQMEAMSPRYAAERS